MQWNIFKISTSNQSENLILNNQILKSLNEGIQKAETFIEIFSQYSETNPIIIQLAYYLHNIRNSNF